MAEGLGVPGAEEATLVLALGAGGGGSERWVLGEGASELMGTALGVSGLSKAAAGGTKMLVSIRVGIVNQMHEEQASRPHRHTDVTSSEQVNTDSGPGLANILQKTLYSPSECAALPAPPAASPCSAALFFLAFLPFFLARRLRCRSSRIATHAARCSSRA